MGVAEEEVCVTAEVVAVPEAELVSCTERLVEDMVLFPVEAMVEEFEY